jgi:hypothetical protein
MEPSARTAPVQPAGEPPAPSEASAEQTVAPAVARSSAPTQPAARTAPKVQNVAPATAPVTPKKGIEEKAPY